MENTEELVPARKKWFSIKEAAEYLDVGEPTLYRWMRENKITFRKVGDSTRFWQEDLDSVMEVFHSERDLDKVREVCPICHHDELVVGEGSFDRANLFCAGQDKILDLEGQFHPDDGQDVRAVRGDTLVWGPGKTGGAPKGSQAKGEGGG